MDSAKFGNATHFVSFVAIALLPEMGQRASNSISVIASIKMFGKTLVSIIVNDCMSMLTKPCPQRSSSFSNMKHATTAA